MPSNDNKNLPPELQKFLDTYFETEAEKLLFMDTYASLARDEDRKELLDSIIQPPTDEELAELEAEAKKNPEA